MYKYVFIVFLVLLSACNYNDDSKRTDLDLVGDKKGAKESTSNVTYGQQSAASQQKDFQSSSGEENDLVRVDLIQDLIFRQRRDKWNLSTPVAHVNLDKLAAAGLDLVFSAILQEPGIRPEKALARGLADMKQLVAQTEGKAVLVSSLAAAKKARANGQLPFMILLEGANALVEATEEEMFDLKQKGVFIIGLAAGHGNGLTDVAVFPRNPSGLTKQGAAFVQKCRDMAIAVDLTHASPAAFWDVFVEQGSLALVSHTAVRFLREHPRNLNDLQIIALHRFGGLMGIVFNRDFIKPGSDHSIGIDDIVAHYDHIKKLGALDAAGLGTDFGGIRPPKDMAHIGQLPQLITALKGQGFTSNEIKGIMGGNAIRFLESVETRHGASELSHSPLLRPLPTECDSVAGDFYGVPFHVCNGYVLDEGVKISPSARFRVRLATKAMEPVSVELFGEPGTPWQIEVQNLSGRVLVLRGIALDEQGRGSISLPGKRDVTRIFLYPTRPSILREAVVWGREKKKKR